MAGAPRGNGPIRTLRTRAWRLVRRLGLVPGGVADGLGEDESLLGTTLPHRVMVYFPDPPGSLYQLEQWYAVLRELDTVHRVVVVLRDSRTARSVRERSGLDAIVVARPATVEDLLSRSAVRLAIYVNHNPANFTNLRLSSMAHVNVMHGDSDKGVTVSNQFKAYDFNFVAGQAAIDRIARHITFYDPSARCIAVGRPQVEEQMALIMAAPPADGDPRTTVLYAPTWEGSEPAAAYGSIVTHGEALVSALLATGGHRVVYRPHPLSGCSDPVYGDADARVRLLIAAAGGDHRVDTTVSLASSIAGADVLVCDVSGVAMDWLPTGRPLVMTVPECTSAVPASTALTDLVPRISVDGLDQAVAIIDSAASDPELSERVRRLTEYHLGDTTPGASTRKFVDACTAVMATFDASRFFERTHDAQPGTDVPVTTTKGF
ncbi:CDP-glycerol glycerophosphotransferase family protein [Cellulomonas sp. PhB143]|uniref:CDP-glycerol glycerophosphotransferase family protein n=1 Tax=Cellulomonas sp. PhB143 TaxID=2485186 RepID=UPI000F4A446B|nr:CDP-glycerol glycerophosphotransferase family protein [Cellulomonas sp. PhB143]ROS78549.1 CDP-glycerol:poly(glycerophosphate) glycerophosphotransferase [Cellulomonas sp. PhB143]